MVEKIGYTRPVNTGKPVKKAGSTGASGFAEALARAEGASGVDATENVGSIGAIGTMGGLLGAQEIDEQEHKKRKAIKRGRLTLDALAGLRDALLMGELHFSTIQQLEKLVAAERDSTTDPLLRQILDEIEVRAAVELAKLEMSGLLPPTV